ncbi:McrB family protein [Pararhodobacter zhoushanensis]|uniref:AAA family ATPase n=1 Tax=Pararhodobacter zhoushanensis TaxID=2479545 RepID=A0ABT3H423_9RHOB|nr:AAA family ATPase [Pararhodobacter zhoushanensis]MCW1934517.1 AAA family ATPase [Pararhodobacter zhoushanensis]
MQYFDIPTIKASIEALKGISANWLIPAFVFAANDVGTGELVDMSKSRGTDQFLDNYFNGSLIGFPPFRSGNNLLRPRLKGVKQEFPGDDVIRQDTKMWGNLFSSRGYREMRQRGELEGEKATVRLTDAFQPAFEGAIPAAFQFEDFLVWLFAFSGFPDEISSWQVLYDHLVTTVLELHEFQEPYRGRFKLTPGRAWPQTIAARPDNGVFQEELAPAQKAFLAAPAPEPAPEEEEKKRRLSPDDWVLAKIRSAIAKDSGRSFLLAGPPGTGKTRYAHDIAEFLADGDEDRTHFLQFHPAFGYDDFVEGFRPAVPDGEGDEKASTGVTYILDQRHFLKFADKARQNPEKLYVLVIDELNRGDVARIFGELLTYLELDYRGKEFKLAISGKPTSLPRNLIVLATANPFDRSVTDLDDALLRRFIVILMEPDKSALERYLKEKGVEQRVLSRTLRLFDILKDAFPAGFGHTNFLGVTTMEDLDDVWTGRVQLGLQRTLLHDTQRFEALRGEIEQLLKIDEEAEAAGQDDEEA